MPDFWKYIKGLFESAADSSPQNPIIHELIQRSEKEITDYEQWKNSLACSRLFDWVNHQHATYLVHPEDVDEAIDFLKTPSAKGFVIYFRKMKYHQREIQHFFDFLKEKVQGIGYRSYVSDTRTYPKGKWVENIQRHYLKPPRSKGATSSQPTPQLYGNINIEICSRNEEVWNLKFSATAYQDRQFQAAKDFGELIGELLN